LKRLKPKSEFSRNVLTLTTGTTVSQAIPVAISPILTRIYTPDDFGVLALFFAITSIFGYIASARYDMAVMLPEKDDDALNIVILGFILSSILSMILFVIAYLFNHQICVLLNNFSISPWLYFVPIVVFFMGTFNMLNIYNTRLKNYPVIAKANIHKSLVMSGTQLLIGVVKTGATGLILGEGLARIAANIRLFKSATKDKDIKTIISKQKIIFLAKKYIKFPKFSLFSGLVSISSVQLANVIISSLFGATTLGFYYLSQRTLGVPISLISSAVGQVFFQQANAEKAETGKAILTFNSTLKKMLIIAVPLFTVLFFIVEDIFAFVFGEEWRIAGKYTQIILPLFFIRFVAMPLTFIAPLFEEQKIELIFQFVLFVLYMSILFISNYLKLSFENYLIINTTIIGIYYFVYLFVLNRIKG
jgi:O-antigen/teichoic acid export membrane protein